MGSWLVVAVLQQLSFEQALEAVDGSPGLRGLSEALERRRSLAAEVPLLTGNPSVGIQPGARRTAQGAVGPELYLTVTQDVNLAGHGNLRREAAQAELEAERREFAVIRRELRLQVAEAWLALWATQTALTAASEEAGLAKEWAARVERGAAAGGFTRVDVAVARAWAAEAALAALSLEGDAFNAGLAVNRAVAREAVRPAIADGALPAIAEPTNAIARRLIEGAAGAPGVTAASALVEAEKARAGELLASRGTTLQLGALAWREGTGDLAAVATLQVTLPLFERAQRERASVESAVRRLDGRLAVTRAAEVTDRVEALHELEHTAELLSLIERDLLPATSLATSGLERRFEAGEATALELVVSRRALVAVKARHARARADVVFARFRVRELSDGGAP